MTSTISTSAESSSVFQVPSENRPIPDPRRFFRPGRRPPDPPGPGSRDRGQSGPALDENVEITLVGNGPKRPRRARAPVRSCCYLDHSRVVFQLSTGDQQRLTLKDPAGPGKVPDQDDRARLGTGVVRYADIELGIVGDHRSRSNHHGVELGTEAVAVVTGGVAGDPLRGADRDAASCPSRVRAAFRVTRGRPVRRC